ncbi:AraC family transcriptional regulator [Paenibacillaceae bacterium WGS1546]|uniref:AraC family transcriptional regulator n=1 Tax=Cohnella sp. WGS1546 TaxID=3366810 RepID=UPI00372D22C2
MAVRFMSDKKGVGKLPLQAYTVGIQDQEFLARTSGFSAHQLFVTKQGNGVLRVQGEGEWKVRDGDAFFIREGIVHEYRPAGREAWTLGFVSFTGRRASELIEDLSLGNTLVIRKEEGTERIGELIEEVWRLSERQNDKTEWEASQAVYSLLMEVHFASRTVESRPMETEGTMERLVSFLWEHCSLPVQVPDIARSVGYTPQHLNRLFGKRYGMPVQKYLHRIRLQKAAELLADEGGLPVREVAARVGMEIGYFIKAFKRAYGTTPGQMRNR